MSESITRIKTKIDGNGSVGGSHMNKTYQMQSITNGTSALVIYRPTPVKLPSGHYEPASYPTPRDYIKSMYKEDANLLRYGTFTGRRIGQLEMRDKLLAIICFLILIVATFSAILVLPFL